MRRLVLALALAISGLVVLNCSAPAQRRSDAPVLAPPLEPRAPGFAQPSRGKGDIRHTFPDTWREVRWLAPAARILAAPQRLSVTPKVGLGPLTITVRWHVPEGLYGVAELTATQTDVDPPMTACRTSRDLQGRAETIEASWELPAGLWDVAGCVRGRCVSQAVVVS